VASRFRGQLATMTSLAAVAMILAACASHAGGAADPSVVDDGTALRHHQTFLYTGRPQQFTVPPNVTKITVDVVAAVGAGQYGGLGGRVWAIVPVTPGENLGAYVGGEGSGSTGGFNGGANGGGPGSGYNGSGGAGASDLREGGHRLTNRILVAGGGGGQGGNGGNGGNGGDTFSGASGGGGGGSSYVEPGAFAQREWRGWKNATGNGIIVFSW
jgi:hypothetical protein